MTSINTCAIAQAKFQCKYCDKQFAKETSLEVHLCEPKRRYTEQNEAGVRLGLQAYLRFYEITQGSARLKTFDDFAKSAYYRAFVKFGRYCVDTRAINVSRLIEWLLKNNKKIDHWCRDSVYQEYLLWYVKIEHVNDALARAIEHAMTWQEEKNLPLQDYLRYGNTNAICHAIVSGRVTAWTLYNCDSGLEFLSNLTPDQISMTWPWIDSDVWQKKFRDYPADAGYARDMLSRVGW